MLHIIWSIIVGFIVGLCARALYARDAGNGIYCDNPPRCRRFHSGRTNRAALFTTRSGLGLSSGRVHHVDHRCADFALGLEQMGRFIDALKTREFANDNEVAQLVDAFENATISAREFTHAAHIAVALSYLDTFSPEEALQRMREKIRFFAAHHGVTNLYHETLTTFWMRLLEHVASSSEVDRSRRRSPRRPKADLPLWRRINLIVEDWTKRRPVEAHYSSELIKSQAAREKSMAPDLLPIPF